WAINPSRTEGGFDSALAHKKLRGSLNRLVLMPARNTVWNATVEAGTWYARVPSPGSCPFCLMLGSRGAVYTRDTVLSTKEMGRYHDHCRCLAVEARGATEGERWDSLPPVNRELNEIWQNNVGAGLHPSWGAVRQRAEWKNLIVHLRREKTGSDEPVRFPPIPGLTLPKYSYAANRSVFGQVEQLPPIDTRAAGHILFGWTDRKPLPPLGDSPVDHGREAHTRADRMGHRWSSQRPGATVFPEHWSDQKIIDAVRDTIEDPDEYQPVSKGVVERTVRKEIDGVVIHVKWINRPGEGPVLSYAFPQRGKGVRQVQSDGKLGPISNPHKDDKKFVDIFRSR
ncbi:MAG: EndoU domain-containing protein, partial [Propionibacteriaceae bacterium]|nr:EndoU domain-containing protein [Propionibacteriaceae bacterium]